MDIMRTQGFTEKFELIKPGNAKLYILRYLKGGNKDHGKSYVIKVGDTNNPPLVLLYVASCGSPIWYKNFEELSKSYSLYAIDFFWQTMI